ncbi:hypothetical protein LWI29_030219 [Acer saccharum]|uniref:PWWP domain-containing protein n=1 Tax=Acer saccharum TaxID=4024 RepID=A0AA39VUM9_ACESA|nr:hypothetical protein LWI29_030219 [Acer saccharum]
MDEDTDMDVSVAKSNLVESTVNVSEHVVGESETRVGPMVEEIVCSHVSVDDGECTNDGGGEGEGNSNNEEIHGRGGLGEVELERDLRGEDGGNDVVADPGSRETDVSGGGEASLDSGFGTAGGGPSVEEKAGRESADRENGGGDVVDEMPKRDDGVLNDGVHNGGIETRIEGSTAVLGSTDGETEVSMEDTAVITSEEGLEGGLVKEEEESASEKDGSMGGEAQNHEAENGLRSSTVVLGAPDGKTQTHVVEEATENQNASGKELVKGAEQGRETDDGEEDAHQDMQEVVMESENASGKELVKSAEPNRETDAHQDIGVSDDKIRNPGIETAGEGTDAGEEDAHQDVDMKEVILESENASGKELVKSAEPNRETDAGGEDAHQDIGVSDDKIRNPGIETAVTGSSGLVQDSSVQTLVVEEAAAVVREEVLNVKDDDLGNNNVEGLASISDDKQIPTANTVEDATSSCQPTQVVGDEVAAMDTKVHPNSKNNKQLKPEGCMNQGTAHDVALVDSNKEKAMEIDEQVSLEQQVNDIEQVCSDGRQQIEVQKIGGSTDNHRSDLVSTGQPTDEVVEGEVTAVDDKVPADPTVKSCSGNDQSLKAEVFGRNAEIDSRVMNGGETALQASEEKVEGLGSAGDKTASVNSTVGQDMLIEEQVIDAEQDGSDGGQEMEVEEQDNDTEQPETTEDKFGKPTIMKVGSSVKSHEVSYLPLEDEDEFKVSDLVWGKVRSHPWWPGQIYDPSDASEKAMKYHKKDCFLVAYFGDRTFAWVDASLLKPFYSHFSQVEKQSNSEVFQNAVNCALEEVSRRIELGLVCSCIPNDTYDDIKFQIVENTGIRQESSMRDGTGDSVGTNSFQPDKLVEYMKALAQSPSDGADRLELVIAKAQLLSFYRLKGYCELPEYQMFGGLAENSEDYANLISKDDEHISSAKKNLESQRSSHSKRKHNLRDCTYPSKKEKSMSELMSFDSLDDEEFGYEEKATSKLVSPSSKKRKAVDSVGDDSLQDGRKTISLAKVSITTPQVPKPSFKIGECIRRAASQMAGSPSILKSNSERFQKFDVDGSDENFEDAEGKRTVLPTDYSSLDGLLSQLHLAARDPMKGFSFLNTITSFFSDFRNSISLSRHSVDKAGGKRKKSSHASGTPETFEFEDMNDTYWTDRVIQNGAEEEQNNHQVKMAEENKNCPS